MIYCPLPGKTKIKETTETRMTFQNFTIDTDADGIALVTWNMPNRSMNVIDEKVIEELAAIAERVATDAAIKGAVLTSGKDSFCGGADLTMLETLSRTFAELTKSQGEEAANKRLFDESRKLSQIARRMETCGKPWVAALNGTAMGGGLELALACHHRVAADSDKTRLGLPEIKVGLFPGGGGTQRIARMLQPADALQFLLKGDQLRLNRAKAMKLIDAVVPQADLVQTAKNWIKAGGTAKAPWDVDGFKLPGGLVYSKNGMMVFPAANALYRRETYDNYPAARAILQVVYEGLQLPMDQALRVESRYFAKILRSPEAAAMIRSLFVSMQDLNKGARRPADVPPKPIKKVGILGAGFMGGRRCLCHRASRHRCRPHRSRSGSRRQGQGAFAKADHRSDQPRPRNVRRSRCAARTHHGDAGLRRIGGLRSYHRGGVRGSQDQGRSDRQGASRDPQRHDLRLQHVDLADHLAGDGLQAHAAFHRHSFLLAGRPHDAGRSDHGQENRRRGAGDGARLRARHSQDADRGQ